MTRDDLDRVLDWAAAEGWNPGLDDAAAFYAADPGGFFIKEVAGEAVAAVSVVNHDPAVAFLGLYLCKPAFRGQGHGMDVWRAGIAHAGTRSIGLDGVPDQQANYARSGFDRHGSTVRFEGQIDAAPDALCRPVTPDQLETLIERDARISGVRRTAFARAWFAPTAQRQTLVMMQGGDITGFATFRACQTGSKVGPLCASSDADALALLGANPFEGPVFVDVQDPDAPLAALLRARGFVPVFETARMFRGTAPDAAPFAFQAIATMELG